MGLLQVKDRFIYFKDLINLLFVESTMKSLRSAAGNKATINFFKTKHVVWLCATIDDYTSII